MRVVMELTIVKMMNRRSLPKTPTSFFHPVIARQYQDEAAAVGGRRWPKPWRRLRRGRCWSVEVFLLARTAFCFRKCGRYDERRRGRRTAQRNSERAGDEASLVSRRRSTTPRRKARVILRPVSVEGFQFTKSREPMLCKRFQFVIVFWAHLSVWRVALPSCVGRRVTAPSKPTTATGHDTLIALVPAARCAPTSHEPANPHGDLSGGALIASWQHFLAGPRQYPESTRPRIVIKPVAPSFLIFGASWIFKLSSCRVSMSISSMLLNVFDTF